jgi:hypothetical protein
VGLFENLGKQSKASVKIANLMGHFRHFSSAKPPTRQEIFHRAKQKRLRRFGSSGDGLKFKHFYGDFVEFHGIFHGFFINQLDVRGWVEASILFKKGPPT